MKNTRSLIALVLAVICGLVAAKMVLNYMNEKEKAEKPPLPKKEMVEHRVEPTPPYFAQNIPRGLRAVSIPVDDVTGVSQNVQRGDIVDIIAVGSAPDESKGHVARVILEAVEVLAAARETAGLGTEEILASSRKVRKWVVTLLLSPEKATLVAAAEASGRLVLSVRHPKDSEPEENSNAMAFDSTYGGKPFEFSTTRMLDVREMITPGMRAFTLQTRDVDGVGGNIKPGDKVDVMLTCPFNHFSTSKGSDVGVEGKITSTHMASRIFLQNIEVLAVVSKNKPITKPLKNPADPSLEETGPAATINEKIQLVILQVTPEESELLTVATDTTSASMIRLLLRNPADTDRVTTTGQLLIELLTEKHEYKRVELFLGTEKRIVKFFNYIKGGIATRSGAAARKQKNLEKQ